MRHPRTIDEILWTWQQADMHTPGKDERWLSEFAPNPAAQPSSPPAAAQPTARHPQPPTAVGLNASAEPTQSTTGSGSTATCAQAGDGQHTKATT